MNVGGPRVSETRTPASESIPISTFIHLTTGMQQFNVLVTDLDVHLQYSTQKVSERVYS